MKRRGIVYLCSLAVILLSLVSCDAIAGLFVPDYVGTWRNDSVSATTTTRTDWTFRKDGTYEMVQSGSDTSLGPEFYPLIGIRGTYTEDGGIITISTDEAGIGVDFVALLGGGDPGLGEMTWSAADPVDQLDITWTIQQDHFLVLLWDPEHDTVYESISLTPVS